MEKKRTIPTPMWPGKKLYLIMRLSLLLFFAFIFSVHAETYSQTTRLTLNLEKSSLVDVLNEIEQQSEYYFYYNVDLDKYKDLNVDIKDKPIDQVLDLILKDKGLSYEIVDRYIVIKKMEEPVMSGVAHATRQQRTVKGQVTSDDGQPLPGVTILVKGTTNGTITDMDGNYILSGISENATLIFSFVGMKTVELTVAGKQKIDIRMSNELYGLEEVVAVGYGVQKKSDITGALVSINAEELKKMPVINPLQGIQGKAAGVDITSNERPGEVGSIRIRGERSLNATNTPLYVVDGIPLQGLGIENLNPSDIESIDILKDASATAIYGSRGANGVLIITTKKGKSGKLTLNYSGTLSVEKMHDRMDMMNSEEWLAYSRLAKYKQGTYTTAEPSYEEDYNVYGGDPYAWANIEKGWASGTWDGSLVPTTDWTSYGLRTAFTNEHTISVSGGTEKIQGYTSIGYLDQQGTQPGQRFQRYTSKTSIDVSPTNWFKMGASVTATWGDQDYGYNYRKSTTGASNIYFALQSMLPYAVPYDDNGDYIYLPGGDVNIINPIRETELCINERQSLRTFGSFYAEAEIINGLKYRINFGPDFYYHRNGIYDDAESINGDGNNVAQYNTHHKRAWTLDNILYYDKTFNEIHNLGITLLQSASKYHYEYSNMKATGVATSAEKWYNLLSAGDLTSFSTGLTETQMLSYMARANYGYKDKYLLTVSGRWDGASQLADGHKWDFFPSAAIAWRIEQEDFMKNVSWVNQLKLRFGVGTTGNSAIDAYATKGAITPLYYTWGSTVQLGQVASDPSLKDPLSMANQDLGWEKTTQYNLGVDFSIFSNRISGSIDVYRSKTKDLLMEMTIPMLTGYPSTWANIGSTENKGIDLTISTINVMRGNFTWSTSLTFTADKNKITELANGNEQDLTNLWFVGKPIGIYYDYEYNGIWKTSEADEAALYGRNPGEIRVKNLNPDDGEVIDANNDRKIVGYKRPKWSGGLTNTFTYKNWDLSCFIYARWGFTMETGAETLAGRFAQRKVDYWIQDVNEDAEYYAPGTNGESGDTYKSSMNYQDGSFIKIRNISLGYTFPKRMLKSLSAENLKVYVQCMNPGLIYSKCSWIDPDLGGSTYNRSFVFGVNLGF